MTDNNNHKETNKEADEVHLNYSPDTSLLLSLGLDETAIRTSAPQVDSKTNLPCSFSDRLGDPHLNPMLDSQNKIKFNTCDDPWNLSSVLQNNVTYTFDPSQLNVMPLNEQMVPLHQMFSGQNFDQINSQFESTDHSFNQMSNLPFFPNQNFFPSCVHSGMDESSVSHPNAMQLIPVELNTNHFSICGTPISHQRATPDITSNIYVSKGTAKLSEAEDWTPNPNRLLDILSELEKLNDVICKLKDECDLPNAKPNLKRERNRLASKACRLKKKATHETNKIKLEGLEIEFKLLVYGLHYMSWEVIAFLSFPRTSNENLSSKLRAIEKKYLSNIKVAGDSDNFVKSVLDRTKENEHQASFNVVHNSIVQM